MGEVGDLELRHSDGHLDFDDVANATFVNRDGHCSNEVIPVYRPPPKEREFASQVRVPTLVI